MLVCRDASDRDLTSGANRFTLRLRSVNTTRLQVIYRQARPLPPLLDTSVLQQWAAWR
jgi:hypothetical protein